MGRSNHLPSCTIRYNPTPFCHRHLPVRRTCYAVHYLLFFHQVNTGSRPRHLVPAWRCQRRLRSPAGHLNQTLFNSSIKSLIAHHNSCSCGVVAAGGAIKKTIAHLPGGKQGETNLSSVGFIQASRDRDTASPPPPAIRCPSGPSFSNDSPDSDQLGSGIRGSLPPPPPCAGHSPPPPPWSNSPAEDRGR